MIIDGKPYDRIKKVTVHYPLPENEEEFERRQARAVAKVLIEVIPPDKIDELIDLYHKRKAEGLE